MTVRNSNFEGGFIYTVAVSESDHTYVIRLHDQIAMARNAAERRPSLLSLSDSVRLN